MKKRIIFLLLASCLFLQTQAAAFLYEYTVLTREEVKVLTDAEILSVYIEAKIELDATRAFHGEAGFTPKEYNRHKKLLNYIVTLRLEMQVREMDVPPIEQWIR